MIEVSHNGGCAVVTLCRGKVNAINEEMVELLTRQLTLLRDDAATNAVVLTGQGPFFSFGFDIPGFLSYSKDEFARYLQAFTDLYRSVFTFPKPVVAALNGHTVAAGLMLAIACDYRIMADRGKLSLNEVSFGSTLFAGSLEILKCIVGFRRAELIAMTGAMFTPQEALGLGLIDELCNQDLLLDRATAKARGYGGKDPVAFKSVKQMLRGAIAEQIALQEAASIREFVDIWYSESTWSNLQGIRIHA